MRRPENKYFMPQIPCVCEKFNAVSKATITKENSRAINLRAVIYLVYPLDSSCPRRGSLNSPAAR